MVKICPAAVSGGAGGRGEPAGLVLCFEGTAEPRQFRAGEGPARLIFGRRRPPPGGEWTRRAGRRGSQAGRRPNWVPSLPLGRLDQQRLDQVDRRVSSGWYLKGELTLLPPDGMRGGRRWGSLPFHTEPLDRGWGMKKVTLGVQGKAGPGLGVRLP